VLALQGGQVAEAELAERDLPYPGPEPAADGEALLDERPRALRLALDVGQQPVCAPVGPVSRMADSFNTPGPAATSRGGRARPGGPGNDGGAAPRAPRDPRGASSPRGRASGSAVTMPALDLERSPEIWTLPLEGRRRRRSTGA
jgi:hypothetical protein